MEPRGEAAAGVEDRCLLGDLFEEGFPSGERREHWSLQATWAAKTCENARPPSKPLSLKGTAGLGLYITTLVYLACGLGGIQELNMLGNELEDSEATFLCWTDQQAAKSECCSPVLWSQVFPCPFPPQG